MAMRLARAHLPVDQDIAERNDASGFADAGDQRGIVMAGFIPAIHVFI